MVKLCLAVPAHLVPALRRNRCAHAKPSLTPNPRPLTPDSSAFTLVEVLAAAVILAAGAVVVCSLAYRCSLNAARGAQYEHACLLLDEILDRAAAGDFPNLARTGAVEAAFPPPDHAFRYRLESTPANDVPGLYEVTASISWLVDSHTYEIQTATLLGALQTPILSE